METKQLAGFVPATEENLFEGSSVVIARSSNYYNTNDANPPDSVNGVVHSIEGRIYVNWDNGTSNSYTYEDLLVASHDEEALAAWKQKPLSTFYGYSLTTDPNDTELVRFGCGAVTVRRTDLRTLADQLQDPETKKAMTEVVELANSIGITIDQLTPKNLPSLTALLQHVVNNQDKLATFIRVAAAAQSHKSPEFILRQRSDVLRKIALTPEDRTEC